MYVLVTVAIWLISLDNTVVSTPAEMNATTCSTRFSRGKCVPLHKCREIMVEFRRGNTAILRDVRCGHQHYQPLVCCVLAPGVPAPQRPVNITSSQPPPGRATYNQDVSTRPGSGFINFKSCGLRSIVIANRILGGSQAGLHEFPWMARLYTGTGRNESLNCAGTLISERYILTAAHCVPSYEPTPLISVHLGQHGIADTDDCDQSEDSKPCEPPPQEVDVEATFVHPQYTGCCQYFNDIALLRLAWVPQFTDFIRPICLPVDVNERTKDLDKTRLVVTGWGTTEEYVNSPVLLKVSVPVIPTSQCQTALKSYRCEITEGQLCAGGELEQDSCNGDSGGPLIGAGTVNAQTRMVQYGVVSYGGDDGCGVKGKPAVYTRVGKYMDWISDTIFAYRKQTS